MSTIVESVKKRHTPHTPKALCIFLAYDSKDIKRLRDAEDKYGYEAYTLSKKELKPPSSHHLRGDITTGNKLCFEVVRKKEWHDINFDMIAFDWHNMPYVYYRDNVPSNKVFEFLLGAPGLMKSGGIVDIPCTPHFYDGHLAAKGSLDDLFDITFLHEHQLAEECFLSEKNEGSQQTIYCKITRKLLEVHSCNKDNSLRAYDTMIEDHGGMEDICMIRLTVKQKVLPPTKPLRPHEEVREEKRKQVMRDNGEHLLCRKRPQTRNEGRLPFAAQVRPAPLVDKKPRLEELDPTIDPSSTTAGTQKKSSSSVAAAATTAAPAPTGILLSNKNDSESGGGGISGTVASGGTMEAASAQAGSSNTEMQVQGTQEVAQKKSKQGKPKSTKDKTIGELLSSVLSLDGATDEGVLDALLKKSCGSLQRRP
jgi:hypothetical protein